MVEYLVRMERKYFIAITLLSAALLGGIFILVRQNGGIGAVSANLADTLNNRGGNWVQIQPRVKTDTGETAPAPEVGEGNMAATPQDKTSAIVKAKAAPIRWCVPPAAGVVPARQVIFSEVAWMGTFASYSDEWIELRNPGTSGVDLSGWQLQNKNQKLKISLGDNDRLLVGGFYLLERTDDGTVPEIKANMIYTGSLANSNEALYLFDKDCRLQDSVAASPDWPAGDNVAKLTMVRLADLGWSNSAISGGTPGK
jgi:hypothetical protein